MNFLCENTVGAAQVQGVNDLVLGTDAAPVADTIVLVATVSQDGVVRIPGPSGLQAFAIGSFNVGAIGNITVSADTGGVLLPVTLRVCETNTSTGACLAPPTPTVTVNYAAATSRSFAFFALTFGSIPFPFNPALLRRVPRRDAQTTVSAPASADSR